MGTTRLQPPSDDITFPPCGKCVLEYRALGVEAVLEYKHPLGLTQEPSNHDTVVALVIPKAK